MLRFRRVNRKYIVTYKEEEFIFAHHESAWVFIFEKRKEETK